MARWDKFPAPEYRETVLTPLFEGFKRHFSEHLLAIHHAHGLMLAERGWLTRDQLRAILAALADATACVDRAALAYTGEHEDYFFWLEVATARPARCRSRGPTAHRPQPQRHRSHRIQDGVARAPSLAADTAGSADRRHCSNAPTTGAATLVVAYTHGQPAQPTTFGHYLGALIEMLLRDAGRLLHALETVDRCSLGAAAITTSGFGLDRHASPCCSVSPPCRKMRTAASPSLITSPKPTPR